MAVFTQNIHNVTRVQIDAPELSNLRGDRYATRHLVIHYEDNGGQAQRVEIALFSCFGRPEIAIEEEGVR